MQRRNFIKTGCSLCLLAASGVLIPNITAMAMGKIKPYKTTLNDRHQAEVPMELFAEANMQIIKVKGTFYDIALHKNDEGVFTAFLMRCTHMDNQLVLTSAGFRCNMHGSEYDKLGNVTKGPSELPLTTYPTTTAENLIYITIPNEE